MPPPYCATRVTAAGGRTYAKRCTGPGGTCLPIDVARWRESASAWAQAAAAEAHTAELAQAASSIAGRVAAVPFGLPSTMVDTYAALAGEASCLLQRAVETRPRPPGPPGPSVPPPPDAPPTPWDWPSLPDVPGFPGLPGFPKLSADLLLLALLIFAAGWIVGEDEEQ